MSKITRQKRTENYTVVNNDILQNTDLSWAAKGMLVYLLHLPDDWQINVADLSNRSRNGRDGTAGIIKELMAEGYILRVKIKNEKSQFKGYDYTVTDEPVNGKAVNGDSVNGKAVTSKYYLKQVLNKENTIEEPQKEKSIPSKEQKEKKPKGQPKHIFPPTLEEVIPLMYAKLVEKKRIHTNIVDCWNNANMQAEKFHIHWEEKGWKIEKLNLAIAKWINNSISYGQVTKPCPIQYPNNPANAQPAQPTKVHVEERPVLTQQDIETSSAHLAAVGDVFKQMGVRV
jgi:hypothetical protein